MITILSLLAFLISQLPNIGFLDKSIIHSGSNGVDQSNGDFKVTTTESVWTVRRAIVFMLLSVAVTAAFFGKSHHE